MSGARRAVTLVGRTLLWGAVAVVLGRGALDIAAGDRAGADRLPVAAAAAAPVEQRRAAPFEPFAVRVVLDLLGGNGDAAQRYLPGEGATVEGPDGRTLDVRDALAVAIAADGPDRATVTVAVRLGSGRWLHLAVPVERREDRLALSDAPALVPEPQAATAAPRDRDTTVDAVAAGELRPVLEGFFASYGGGDEAAVDRYATPGRSLRALDGPVELVAVDEVHVANADGTGVRQVRATVRWRDVDGFTVRSVYSLTAVQQDGRWYVNDLGAAAV